MNTFVLSSFHDELEKIAITKSLYNAARASRVRSIAAEPSANIRAMRNFRTEQQTSKIHGLAKDIEKQRYAKKENLLKQMGYGRNRSVALQVHGVPSKDLTRRAGKAMDSHSAAGEMVNATREGMHNLERDAARVLGSDRRLSFKSRSLGSPKKTQVVGVRAASK